jgi:glutathione S-transferase
MVVVHHLNNSRSQRILWLLEELDVPYEVKRYERNVETMRAPESLKAVHPLGKSPVITDDGVTVAETGAIIEYLVEKYAGGRLIPPAGTEERRRYTYWLHFAEGSAMTPLLMKLVFMRLGEAKVPFFVKPVVRRIVETANATFIDAEIRKVFDFIESELGRSPWFAGEEMTAADVQMSFPLEAAASRAGLDHTRPKSLAFLERIHARPAYRRALERGGEYAYAK